MTSPSNSHPGGAAAGSGGMLTAEPFGRYGRREGTTRRKSQVVDRSGTATELARVRARLAELDAEQRQLLQELSALEAQEAAETAAQAKRPAFEDAPRHERIVIGRKGRAVPQPVCWPPGRVSSAMGKPKDGTRRLFARLLQ